MKNKAQIGHNDHYSLHNIFIISVITKSSNHSTYKLFILLFKSSCKTGTFHACSNGTSKYFNCFLTNILLRSEGFTEQSFAIENKFLPRTVLRSLSVGMCTTFGVLKGRKANHIIPTYEPSSSNFFNRTSSETSV